MPTTGRSGVVAGVKSPTLGAYDVFEVHPGPWAGCVGPRARKSAYCRCVTSVTSIWNVPPSVGLRSVTMAVGSGGFASGGFASDASLGGLLLSTGDPVSTDAASTGDA